MPYSMRRPTLDDAQNLLTLMTTCDTAVIGFPDTTLDDVLDELREPDVVLERDAWIALDDESGAAIGSVVVFTNADSDIVELDIYVAPDVAGLDAQMWDRAEARGTEFGRACGFSELRFDIGIHRADERQRRVATARGYSPATAFYRMRADHDSPRPPGRPDGVVIETVGQDTRLRQAALDIHNASFADHYGHVTRTRDWYDAWLETSSTTGWDHVRVLSVDGTPAALLIATTQFVEDENCGYVQTLGVLEGYRGRGLGRLLLLDAFTADAAQGRVGTLLHVDSNNVTPALGLYESVGMRVVLVIDSWRKTVTM